MLLLQLSILVRFRTGIGETEKSRPTKGPFTWRRGTPDSSVNMCSVIMRDYMDRRVTPPKRVT